jgi:hypothetical protein
MDDLDKYIQQRKDRDPSFAEAYEWAIRSSSSGFS